MEAKNTLFHIDWGDGDTTFIIAPDEQAVRERMPDGKDMVNYVVRLDNLYQRIFRAGIREVVEWIHENSIGCISHRDIEEDRVRSGVGLSFIEEDWQAFLKENRFCPDGQDRTCPCPEYSKEGLCDFPYINAGQEVNYPMT